METFSLSTPKYSEYYDSGVKSLGEIPSHWKLVANRYLFKINKNVVGKKSGMYDLLSLTLNGVIKRDMENPQGKFPAEFDTYQEVKKGELIFCLFDVEETPRTVGLSPFDGMITGAYTVLKPVLNSDPRFFYYFYLNLDADKRMKFLYTGLRNTISKENFFSFKTFVPPLSEQTAIANFLNKKTAQIDQAIAQKERLIELLKERRQILIHKAVTRGLNPDVKMKDSGVEWIGVVPEHWEVKKVKYLFSQIGGGTPSKDKADFWNGDIPWVSPKDMKSEFIYSTEDFITKKALEKSTSNYIKSDTLLMVVRSGILQRTIPVAIAKVDLTINQDMKAFIPLGRMQSDFFYFYIKGNDEFLIKDWVKQGATVESIEADLIKNALVPVPSKGEQQEILSYISSSTSKIVKAISVKENEIEKLKEYKATLINAAVTGKIKVSA